MSAMLFNLILEYILRSIQENKIGIELNGTKQILTDVDDLDLVGGNRDAVVTNMRILLETARDVGLEDSEEKIKYMITTRSNRNQNEMNLLMNDKIFDRVENFNYLGVTINNNNDLEMLIKKLRN